MTTTAHTGTPRPVIATEVVLPGVVEPDGLQVRRRGLPAPGPGQVVVAVEASGVSFAEQQMRRGKYYDQPAFPFVPGYDLVGTVSHTGAGVDPALLGTRVAALTGTGGWASAVLLRAADLVPVPDGVDPAEAETVVVNGITAQQMLHRAARVRAGQTILVHGANGGVGSTLVQLARHAGVRVIGTSSPRHHDAVRALGAEPLDHRGPDLPARVRALAPDGVDAVFDHVGGPGLVDSWRLLAPGGTLVSYGSASTKDDPGDSRAPILLLVGRLLLWNALPNAKKATFFNIWAGRRRRDRQARLREDLTTVLALLQRGVLRPQVAARVPLEQAAEALQLAESGTVVGKVVLVADPPARLSSRTSVPRAPPSAVAGGGAPACGRTRPGRCASGRARRACWRCTEHGRQRVLAQPTGAGGTVSARADDAGSGAGVRPIPEVYAAAARLHLLTDEVDLLRHLELVGEVARWLVPSCVGVSLSVLVDGETYTLTASSDDSAVLDAAQYLDGSGPCVDAARYCQDVQVDDVLDEGRWQFFEQAAASRAVRSSLSLPLRAVTSGSGDCTPCGCVGSLNLYASKPYAFASSRDLLAELFRVPAQELVSNADLSFTTRDLARQLPVRLEEKAVLDRAADVFAALRGWTPAEARSRIRRAAERAGRSPVELAGILLALDVP